MSSHHKLIVNLKSPDDKAKHRNGFRMMFELLSYIFIVCNGDQYVIMKRNALLTWFEELFLHF